MLVPGSKTTHQHDRQAKTHSHDISLKTLNKNKSVSNKTLYQFYHCKKQSTMVFNLHALMPDLPICFSCNELELESVDEDEEQSSPSEYSPSDASVRLSPLSTGSQENEDGDKRDYP
jgi:hypothetical protein